MFYIQMFAETTLAFVTFLKASSESNFCCDVARNGFVCLIVHVSVNHVPTGAFTLTLDKVLLTSFAVNKCQWIVGYKKGTKQYP